ncbi:MAG: response regulator transcription factor [Polyangiales bacterium]
MIRVVLVDDQTLVRQGIRSLLELTPDIAVVAEAADGEQALTILETCSADVVRLDVRMPKLGGLAVLATLAQRATRLAVILLTTFHDDAVALDGIRLGARGFLLKDVSLDQLTSAIRAVVAGGTLFSPAVTDRVVRGIGRLSLEFPSAGPRAHEGLTRREIEVLRLMASGASNREIALALGAAEGTIKNHASSILAKLGVRDRTRAVLRALELGLL